MRTMPAELKKAIRRSGARPIVGIMFDNVNIRAARIDVRDFSAASGGQLDITRQQSAFFQFTEGLDFNAATSNEATAASIYGMLTDASSGFVDENTHIFRESGTSFVWIIHAGFISIAYSGSGIDGGTGQSAYAVFSNATSPINGGWIPHSLVEVKMTGTRVDPISRESSIGSADVVLLDDPFTRRFFTLFNMRNAKARLVLTEETAPTSLFTIALLRLSDMRYEPGAIRLTLSEPSSILAQKNVTGQMATRHPLNAIKQIVNRAGAAGDIFDISSLDLTSISQNQRGYCVSRAQGYDASYIFGNPTTNLSPWHTRIAYGHSAGGDTPAPAWDFIQEIVAAFGGTIYTDMDSGALKFREYDLNASVDWVFGKNDVAEFSQISAFDNAITRVTIPIGQSKRGAHVEYAREEDSSFNLSIGNDTPFRSDYTLNSPYFNGVAYVVRTYNGTAASNVFFNNFNQDISYENFVCRGTAASGLTWGHVIPSGNTAVAALHSDQTSVSGVEEGVAFLRVERHRFYHPTDDNGNDIVSSTYFQWAYDDGFSNETLDQDRFLETYEYVAVTPVALTQYTFESGILDLVEGDESDQPYRPMGQHFKVNASYNSNSFTSGRAGFGSSSVSNDPVDSREILITDVTLPFKRAKQILTRFAYGAPVIEFTLPLHYAEIEIGDVFQLEGEDRYVGYLQNNTDGTVFEVTALSHNLVGDSPGIRVEGTFLRLTTPYEVFINIDDDPAPQNQGGEGTGTSSETLQVTQDDLLTEVWVDTLDSTTNILGY